MEGIGRKADGRRIFSVEFKRQAVGRVVSGEKTLAELSRELEVQPSVLRNWMRLVERGGTAAVAAGEDVVPASRVRELEQQVKDLQRLVGKRAHRQRPYVVVEAQRRIARQVGLRGERDLGRQVAEVGVVGDHLRVDRRAPPGPELGRVVPSQEIAVALGDAVVGKEFAVDLPEELRFEVTQLLGELEAALDQR